MRILIALLAMLAVLIAAPMAFAKGTDIRVAPQGEFDWRSDFKFAYPPEPYAITDYSINGTDLLNTASLQIGPCAWHWFDRTGDFYLSIPCDDAPTVHRIHIWGSNFTNNPIDVRLRWHLD